MGKNQNEYHKNVLDHLLEVIHDLTMLLVEALYLLAKKGGKLALKKMFKMRFKDPIVMKDLKSKKKSKKEGSYGWLVKSSRPLEFNDVDSKRHTMIIGPTGYGKTNLMTLMHERVAKANNTVVFFDPKASYESMNMFKEACTLAGRKVYFFNEFAPNKTSFNPLLDGNVDQICDRVISACSWSDPFYKAVSVKALKEAVTYLKSQGEVITVKKITELIRKNKGSDKVLGVVSQLESINMSEFSDLLNDDSTETLSFSRLRKENACLYIGISTLGYLDTARLLNKLFLDNLLYHCYESLKVESSVHESRRPMSVFFDEFGSVVNPKFIELQNKCRAADIEITYATQCPADIKYVSDDLCDQVFENTENLFIFKQRVPGNVDYITQQIGTITDEKKTFQLEDQRRTGLGSVREVERLELHPSVLRNLEVGKCVYINKKDRFIDLLNVRKHERRKSLGLKKIESRSRRSAF